MDILSFECVNPLWKRVHNQPFIISIDTATFTKYNATTAEILIHIWARMHSNEFDSQTINLLEERFWRLC